MKLMTVAFMTLMFTVMTFPSSATALYTPPPPAVTGHFFPKVVKPQPKLVVPTTQPEADQRVMETVITSVGWLTHRQKVGIINQFRIGSTQASPQGDWVVTGARVDPLNDGVLYIFGRDTGNKLVIEVFRELGGGGRFSENFTESVYGKILSCTSVIRDIEEGVAADRWVYRGMCLGLLEPSSDDFIFGSHFPEFQHRGQLPNRSSTPTT